MATTLRQKSFRAGEVAPGLHARDDLEAYAHALRRSRNGIVTPHGSWVNRPGYMYLGDTKYHTRRSRLIPFIFGGGQVFQLEFGHEYIRFWKDGGLVLDGAVPYEVVSPYTEEQLGALKYAQSGDVITLVHPDVAPHDLTRIANTNWSLAAIDFSVPSVDPNVYPEANSFYIEYDLDAGTPGLKRRVEYAITRMLTHTATGRVVESLPYRMSNTVVGAYNGAVVKDPTLAAWDAGTTYSTPGTMVRGSNGVAYRLVYGSGPAGNNLNRDPVQHISVNTGLPTTNVNEMYWHPIRAGLYTSQDSWLALISPAEQHPKLAWPNFATPAGYTLFGTRVYRGQGTTFGLIADLDSTQTEYVDGGEVAPDFTHTPPTGENPFATEKASAVAFFEQRRLFGITPGDILGSRLADIYNHSPRAYLQPDDAFRFTLASLRLEEIRWLLPLRALLVGTSESIWVVSGAAGVSEALSATSVRARVQTYRGAALLDPLVIGNAALVVTPLGNAVQELAFDFASDTYQSTELSLAASHLIEGRTIEEWCYQRAPFGVAWAKRSDGVLLGLSYVRELDVAAWSWHDTAGAFESVCAVPEGTEDVVYAIVNRTVGGQTRRYVERSSSRTVNDARLGVFLDSALTYDGRNTGATTVTVNEGPGGGGYGVDASVAIVASADAFAATDVGNDWILDPDADLRWDAEGNPLPPLGPVRLRISGYTDPQNVTAVVISPAVPAAFQATPTADWARAVDEISGLDHLEGCTVNALADAGVVADLVVTNGAVALEEPAAVVHVGLPYVSDLELLDLSVPGADLRHRVKAVRKVSIDVEKTRALLAGCDLDHLTKPAFRRVHDGYGPVPLFTGTVELLPSGDWSKTGRAAVRQKDPLPLTVLGVTREVEIGGS